MKKGLGKLWRRMRAVCSEQDRRLLAGIQLLRQSVSQIANTQRPKYTQKIDSIISYIVFYKWLIAMAYAVHESNLEKGKKENYWRCHRDIYIVSYAKPYIRRHLFSVFFSGVLNQIRPKHCATSSRTKIKKVDKYKKKSFRKQLCIIVIFQDNVLH